MTRVTDDSWKKVQQNTFTNWINNSLRGHLKKADRQVDNLTEGFQDGLTLIQLLETVSRKKVGRHNQNPKIKAQMMENLEASFKFMDTEDIKLVNIGPLDLYNGELKLIMGLIWTLIRRYQIRSTGRALSTKASMLAWINTQIPDQNIKNFTTDWNSGVALCALVDRIQPGVCPHYGTLDRTKKLENCGLGMELAEDKLSIPKILEAGDLSHPDIDEISVMTYISYFCKPANEHLLHWVQKKLPDRNITNFQTDWNNGVNLSCLVEALCPRTIPKCRELDPHKSLENLVEAMKLGEDHLGVKPVIKPSQMADPAVDELNVVTYLSRFQYARPIPQPQEVTCTGKGLYKAFVGRPATFDIDGSKGGVGELKVIITAKSGSPITAEIKPHAKQPGLYEVKYVPRVPSKLKIEVMWSGYVIPASPFSVDVLDPGALTFTSKYITGGHCAMVGKTVTMDVGGLTDISDLYVLIQHADGHTETAKVIDNGNGKAECTYIPTRVGKDEVFAKIAGTDLPGSPFEVKVVDPNQCNVSQHDPPLGKPILVNKKVSFAIIAHGENLHGIVAIVKSPSGPQEVPIMRRDDAPNLGTFTPVQTGSHEVVVTCAGENIRGSPFTLDICDPSKCAFLDTIPRYLQMSKPHKVHLSTKGAGPGTVDVTSSQVGVLKVEPKKGSKSDLVGIEFSPSTVGESTVSVKYNGAVIAPTPHTMFVCDASRCSAYGPGLTSGKGKIQELFAFTVQVKQAGRGELTVKPKGPKTVYAADIKKNTDDTYSVSFTSYEIGDHEIDIFWGGEPIPNSPYKVEFCRQVDISKITVRGSGLEKSVANRRAEVTVYARESKLIDSGALNVVFSSASGAENENPDVDIYDKENGSYIISYTPKVAGVLKLTVAGDGEQITGSPFNIKVEPEPKAEMCTIRSRSGEDLFKDSSEYYQIVGKPLELTVDTTNAGTGSLTVTGEKPDGSSQRIFATDETKGGKKVTLLKFETTALGTHKLSITWEGTHIPKSPFQIHVVNPGNCKPTGDFPSYIKIGETKTVAFTAQQSGPGELSAHTTDKQVSTAVKAKNLTLRGVSFGTAKVHVTYGGYDVTGSPYSLGVCDPSKIILDLAALKGQKYIVGKPFSFNVNTRNAGHSILQVKPMESHKCNIEVTEMQNGKWKVTYTQWTPGSQGLSILWGDWDIRDSPFRFDVSDPKKVIVKGLPDPKTYVPIMGEAINFTIDYTQAGAGSLTTVAKLEGGEEKEIEREETDDGASKTASLQIIPNKPGKLELVLKFNGVNILPAVCIYEVPDPSRFQVTAPKGFGQIKEYVKFPITGVGKDTDLKITAIHRNHDATVKTEPGKDASTVIARFTPKHTGEYKVKVMHKGQNVAGSPFTMQIANPDACKPIGDLPSVVHTGNKGTFEIDTSQGGLGSISFQIETLSGDIQPEITSAGSKHTIQLSRGIGSYRVSIKYAEYTIPSTPFDVHFVDSSQVTWTSNRDLTTVKQGEVVIIELDCTKAGQATPKVKTVGPQSEQPSQIKDNKDGKFTIILNPWQVGKNTVEISYGGRPIPKTPINFEVVKPVEARTITATGEAFNKVIAGVPASVTINTPNPGLLDRGLLKAKFLSEEDLTVPSIDLTDTGDGRYDLTLLSENEGEFSLDISCDESSIIGSPFKISVSAAPQSDKCKAFGPALRKNAKLVVQDPVKFTVDTTNAGTGALNISAKQPNGKTIQVYQNNESGQKILHHLKFDPEIVGSHTVTITWDGADIPGSPFNFNIVDPSKVIVNGLPPQPHGLAYINEPFKFSVTLNGCGTSSPRVYIDPPGDATPTPLSGKSTSDGVLGYQHAPKFFGVYLVSVEVSGVDVPGSPFKLSVIDPSKFSIAALSLKGDYAVVCETVSIYIHGNASSDDTLSVTAHGPTADLNVETTDIGDGKHQADFVPIEPGSYEVFVEYAGTHVNGSPFTVKVADPSKCQVLGDVPKFVQVGKSEEFIIKTRGAGMGKLETLVNEQEKSPFIGMETINQGLDTYSVVLTGKKVSDIILDVQWAGYSIPQSPFAMNVCDANQCTAYGQALDHKRGTAGEPIVFTVKSKDAGKGKLTVLAKGPSAQYNVDMRETAVDTHEVTFTPWEVGEHTIEVQWGSADIPKSPFVVAVSNPNDSTVCNATGEGLKTAIAGTKSTFMIISSEAGLLEKNALKVTVMGVQSHAEVVIKDNNNGSYNVEYVAPSSGAYVASVTFFDRQIPGSPFKINVFPKPDASKCFAYGPALNQNSILIAGSPLELFVDTKEGGHGLLRVYIQGPNDHRPKVFIADDSQGVYSIKFDAMKPGKYFVVVAWSEEHIPGSPFKLRVRPAADAGKVKAYGPGLIDGFLGGPGQFTVETKNAGVGTLLIRVHGLKDSFRIEAHPFSSNDPRTLIASYNPRLISHYVVFVRWSGIHIPGSPFNVSIRGRPGSTGSSKKSVDSEDVPKAISSTEPTKELFDQEKEVLDDSFAKAAPQYEAPKRKKQNSKQEKRAREQEEKQQAARPMSTNSGRGLIMVQSPSVVSSVGPIGPSLKMKPNPGMAMAFAQTGPPPDIEIQTTRKRAPSSKTDKRPTSPQGPKERAKSPPPSKKPTSPKGQSGNKTKSPAPRAARSKSPPSSGKAQRSKSPPSKRPSAPKSPPPKKTRQPPPSGKRAAPPGSKGGARNKNPSGGQPKGSTPAEPRSAYP